ncbi:hypothetical protein Y032_0008g121 [Ancylostoma ceylanicum]|uniref:Uncharacterized protein n=1 Tax=Ancylostoma ceylanicum TaxID=53326 RepID=A0A016VLP2_9BILA|nr:hypothetical protein Y032_0008g121 [Ancylostoma ceylanicum]
MLTVTIKQLYSNSEVLHHGTKRISNSCSACQITPLQVLLNFVNKLHLQYACTCQLTPVGNLAVDAVRKYFNSTYTIPTVTLQYRAKVKTDAISVFSE